MMPITLNWDEMKPLIAKMDINDAMRNAFIEYSNGNAVIPPVGELIMQQPPGEVHIKYGYIKGGSHYVIKIASGFPNNQKENIKPGQGMMLLFDIQTGMPEAILIDDANLTDIRTAIAGAIASQALSNQDLESFTVVGTGVQAYYQAKHVSELMNINKVRVWGRDPAKAYQLRNDLPDLEVNIEEVYSAVDQIIDNFTQQLGSIEKVLEFYNKEDEASFRQDIFEINKVQKLASMMQSLDSLNVNSSPVASPALEHGRRRSVLPRPSKRRIRANRPSPS